MSRKKITLPTDLIGLWTDLAGRLGYGERGRNKLIRRLLEVAEEMPFLFRKR